MFAWFFGSKDKEAVFESFENDIDNLSVIEGAIDALIEDKSVDESHVRSEVQKSACAAKDKFDEFVKLLGEQEAELRLFALTSVEEKDFVGEIKLLADQVQADIKKLVEESIDSFEQFVVESGVVRKRLRLLATQLVNKVKEFHVVAKTSLEWNYRAGSQGAISVRDFKNAVRKLGGFIDPSMGKGDHFGVVFRPFKTIVGPSRSDTGKISGETLKNALRQQAALITPIVDIDFLICYFLKMDEVFRDTFLKRYKHLFELS